jgi:diguanylate cyclase (GGDEF)-like protein
MAERAPADMELTLQTLNDATRQIASELDTSRLVERILDTLADFGRARRVSLLTVQDEGANVEVAGLHNPEVFSDPDRCIPVDSLLGGVLQSRQPATFPGLADDAVPLPAAESRGSGQCLCLPLFDSRGAPIGLMTLDRADEDPLSPAEEQALQVITTLVAVALENARLFSLATTDGLTGLYVRRFFEIRVQEEAARLRRHGGAVALLMTDIDHFKRFNDTYGHQQGDTILRELAHMFRESVRHNVDVPCRYGGEEYVIILPVTDLHGALHLAERLRSACEAHRFPGNGQSLQVTLSAGVAAMDRDSLVPPEELLRRADMALYHAKETGRNRVRAWLGEGEFGEPEGEQQK